MQKQYKVNSAISAKEVRLIGEDGKQIGVLTRDEALEYAVGIGADLVLIGEKASPPVAKVIDFKKFLYQEQKKEKESKKSQKNTGLKEIWVGGPLAGQADIDARIRRTEEFLKDGFSVKVVVRFTGRQMAHPEFGHRIIDQFKVKLSEVGKIDKEARFEGKRLTAMFSPGKGS